MRLSLISKNYLNFPIQSPELLKISRMVGEKIIYRGEASEINAKTINLNLNIHLPLMH